MHERGAAMKMMTFMMTLFFLSGCVKKKLSDLSFNEIDYKMTKEWIYATSIKIFVPENQVISRPPGLEQLILKLELPEIGGIEKKSHCVYYVVGFKQKKSSLTINELKGGEDCPIISEQENAFLKMSELNHLEIKQKDFQIHLSFEYLNKKQLIKIPLYNLEGLSEHSKLRPMRTKSFLQGLKLLNDSFDFSLNKNLGKISDRFSLGTAIRCHKVDKNCQDVGENRCSDCKYGWYEVVDFQCPQGGSKFCGQNHCGEKNEPACPRGEKVVDRLEAGICQSDLALVSNGEKILVCQ